MVVPYWWIKLLAAAHKIKLKLYFAVDPPAPPCLQQAGD
jgi:hypothetical protein